MKTFILCLSLVLGFTVGKASLEPSVKSQLLKLNKFWVWQNCSDPLLLEKTTIVGEISLIRTHLSLVEKRLRQKATDHLSNEQKLKRDHCLDILHDYWLEGVFPKNLYHAERTPYFIDDFGTACAVGQLIIETDNKVLADKISAENNFGYIHDLNRKYAQLSAWATSNGFTIDELAWIQPCYAIVDTVGIKHPTCHVARNGYFRPDFSSLPLPHDSYFRQFLDTVWVVRTNMCGQRVHNYLGVGKYEYVVRDGNNVIHTFPMTMTAIPAPIITVLKDGDFNSCNGSATINVQGGVPPISYKWKDSPDTLSNFSGFCEGTYSAMVYEAHYFLCAHEVKLFAGTLSIPENNSTAIKFMPNPVEDELKLQLPEQLSEISLNISIMNSQGKVCITTSLSAGNDFIDVSQLPPGIYFIKVQSRASLQVLRFVKI